MTWGEFPVFLAQVILQPFFLLFVFGKVLGSRGYTRHGYANQLFPGLLALTAVITSMQTRAFPLVIEVGGTKEIEDRLLAPLSPTLVAAEKVVVFGCRLPLGDRDHADDPDRHSRCSARSRGGGRFSALPRDPAPRLGARLGDRARARDALVKPNRINIVFALLVFTPLLFTGCSQYPWPSLDQLRSLFQVVTALNPMTYVRRGMRGALVPEVPHIAPWICLGPCFRSRSPRCSQSASAASSGARSTEPNRWRLTGSPDAGSRAF